MKVPRGQEMTLGVGTAVRETEENEMGTAKLRLKEPGELLTELSQLHQAVKAYLSECDNPVPDASYRRILRNRLRDLTGAPAEPPRKI